MNLQAIESLRLDAAGGGEKSVIAQATLAAIAQTYGFDDPNGYGLSALAVLDELRGHTMIRAHQAVRVLAALHRMFDPPRAQTSVLRAFSMLERSDQ